MKAVLGALDINRNRLSPLSGVALPPACQAGNCFNLRKAIKAELGALDIYLSQLSPLS
jgi:hypothetical protein